MTTRTVPLREWFERWGAELPRRCGDGYIIACTDAECSEFKGPDSPANDNIKHYHPCDCRGDR